MDQSERRSEQSQHQERKDSNFIEVKKHSIQDQVRFEHIFRYLAKEKESRNIEAIPAGELLKRFFMTVPKQNGGESSDWSSKHSALFGRAKVSKEHPKVQ